MNLFENCKIIERYTYSDTLNSVSGYLLITLTGCVIHISEMNLTQGFEKLTKKSFSMR